MNRFLRPPDTAGQKAFLPIAIILSLVSVSYFVGLGSAPLYLGGDEAQFAAHADSIASRGRDLNGHFLPLFFNITDPLRPNSASGIWYQPMLFYLMALVLKVAPMREWAVRIPTAAIGFLDGLLMFAVARRLFKQSWYALLAALLLLMSPAHYIFSRVALDYICPLPFALGWLWCLVAFNDTNRTRYLVVAGLLLAIGFFSYIASWITMSLYFAATAIVAWRSTGRFAVKCAAIGAGFGPPLLAAGTWLWVHPDMVIDTVHRYGLGGRRPLEIVHGLTLPQMVISTIDRLSIYWEYWDPSYLFFSGGSNPTQATRNAGVFLLPLSVFFVSGLYDLWRRPRSRMNFVLLFGLASAPLPIIVTLPQSVHYAIGRELVILPFGVLVSMCGVALLLRQPGKGVRFASVLLLLAMPIQFGFFLNDYFTGYRTSSAERFDPVNVRDVAAAVIASDSRVPVPAVYLSDNLDDGAIRWKFYALKYGREDLWRRTHEFSADHFNVGGATLGSLFVVYADDPNWASAQGKDTCVVAQVVLNAVGARTAIVWRKIV
jgi:4-amino-4-deoxy-L-arabinose transferase-like glycosyltransferase